MTIFPKIVPLSHHYFNPVLFFLLALFLLEIVFPIYARTAYSLFYLNASALVAGTLSVLFGAQLQGIIIIGSNENPKTGRGILVSPYPELL